MTARNWETLGIEWSEEPVQKQHGDHATDRSVIGQAQIPVLKDLAAFRANVPEADNILLGIWDGTSARVQAQDVSRRMLAKGATTEVLRDAIWNRLLGIRQRVAVVKTHPLPGNTRYEGDNLVEYRQQYAAALVDQGVQADLSLTIASTITF